MTSKLVAMYEKGSITAEHLVVESLSMLEPANPGLVLEGLSNDVLERVLAYALEYRPGKMRTNYGRQPTAEQVQAAKEWIEAKRRPSGRGMPSGADSVLCAGRSPMSEPHKKPLKLDEIGYWSEVKLDIVREYAKAYSTILAAQERPRLYHVYIDAFAGAGVHKSKTRGDEIPGSPQIAVNTQPPFREYHFIDLDGSKVENLRTLFQGQQNVMIYHGDCNQIMLERVLPRVRFEDYRRGLCLLDPYGLHLNWEVIRTAGQMKTIDLFLNFPIMDMNMNVFWKNPEGVDEADIARMNAFWGDGSWRQVAYREERDLFGPVTEKNPNEVIAEAFRDRLRSVAGFKNVPPPVPMRNTNGAVVYYLYFASQKPVAQNIVTFVFNKYKERGAPP